ncbi:Uncharacterized protein dnm_001440 [Desulfonema magnum]|uniref:Uncharacterized protein n=1 Tax=Desulfonema magnum TaxID=45655 RepID=A0A975BEW5_9BACT|nr:Uncharacterized protein dnm_001440 [Desulfonema magnum]
MDADNQLTEIRYPGSTKSFVVFDYDENNDGLLTKKTEPEGNTAFS